MFCPYSQGTPPYLRLSSFRNSLTGWYNPQGTSLEAQVRTLWSAHDTTIGELKSINELVLATKEKEELRNLWSDLNPVLGSSGLPATFIDDAEVCFDRIYALRKTLEHAIYINRQPPNRSVSEASHHA